MQHQILYIYLTVLKVGAAILILVSFHFSIIKFNSYSVFSTKESDRKSKGNVFSSTFIIWLVKNLVEDPEVVRIRSLFFLFLSFQNYAVGGLNRPKASRVPKDHAL